MQAIIEAPGPGSSLHCYVKGPRPDINDEWGSTSGRGRTGGGGGEGARRGAVMSDDGSEAGGAEDRPSGGPGAYYTLPWPSGWKLERGSVSKFLRALAGPIMLVRRRGAYWLAQGVGFLRQWPCRAGAATPSWRGWFSNCCACWRGPLCW